MKLQELKRYIGALPPKQLVKLDIWIHDLLENIERTDRRRKMKAKHGASHKTYRSEIVRCGKKGCKCSEGKLHGPYWYAYWTEGGKTRSQYIGKKLPRGVETRKGSNRRGVR
jgi:hypothetical protein